MQVHVDFARPNPRRVGTALLPGVYDALDASVPHDGALAVGAGRPRRGPSREVRAPLGALRVPCRNRPHPAGRRQRVHGRHPGQTQGGARGGGGRKGLGQRQQ